MTARTMAAATCEQTQLLDGVTRVERPTRARLERPRRWSKAEVRNQERVDRQARLDRLDRLAGWLVVGSRVLLAALAAMVVLSELVRVALP